MRSGARRSPVTGASGDGSPGLGGAVIEMTLETASTVITAPPNTDRVTYVMHQDPTGGRAVVWPANYIAAPAWAPDTAANKTNVAMFVKAGAWWYMAGHETGLLPPTPGNVLTNRQMLGIALGDWCNSYTSAQMAQMMADIKASGFDWVRIPIYWQSCYQGAGAAFKWTGPDKFHNAAIAAGLNVYAMVGGCPLELSMDQSITDTHWRAFGPAAYSEFVRFVTAAAQRFGTTIRHWLFGNEPNLVKSAPYYARFWAGDSSAPNATTMATVHALFYNAIKAVNPNLLVGAGGWSNYYAANANNRTETFAVPILNDGLFDFVDCHAYPNFANAHYTLLDPITGTTTTNSLTTRTEALRTAMVTAGQGAKTIWSGEGGYHTDTHDEAGWSGVTEAQSASAIPQIVSYWAGKAYSGVYFFYTAFDSGSTPDDVEMNFGQLRHFDSSTTLQSAKAGRQVFIDQANLQWGTAGTGPTITFGPAVTTGTGPLAVALPTHAAGDIVGIACVKSNAASSSLGVSATDITAGWVVDVDYPDVSANTHVLIASKVATGAETTVTITGVGGNFIFQTFRITGAKAAADRVEGFFVSTAASGTAISLANTTGNPDAGDIAVAVAAVEAAIAAPAANNAYTVRGSNLNAGFAASKVLTDTNENVTMSWTTARISRGALVVYKKAGT